MKNPHNEEEEVVKNLHNEEEEVAKYPHNEEAERDDNVNDIKAL